MKKIMFELDKFVDFLNGISEEKYGKCGDRFWGLFRITSDGEIYEDWSTILNEGKHTEKKELKGEIVDV